MAISMGIVGLPNVGKSTLFNALTRAQNAESANYPFCTIEPNKAIVPVPDVRVDRIVALVKPKNVVHATTEFMDIAGLVKGASRGEGLGNQFLGNIREAEAVLHVVRCFEDDDIIHVDGSVDPIRDIEVIETELLLHDLQSLTDRIPKIEKATRGDKSQQRVLDAARELLTHLERGEPVTTFALRGDDALTPFFRDMRFLSDKPVVYAANVDEGQLNAPGEHLKRVVAHGEATGREVVALCASLEEEMAGLDDADREEFLGSYGITESGLDRVAQTAYRTLGLISYFTAGEKEVRAWTIHEGDTAPVAAGKIHTDFEKGFISAEVIAYDDYIAHDGEQGAKAAGRMRKEGRDYVVQDGDVIEFRFNV